MWCPGAMGKQYSKWRPWASVSVSQKSQLEVVPGGIAGALAKAVTGSGGDHSQRGVCFEGNGR